MYPLLIKKEVLKTCYIIIIISLSCALFSFTKIDFNRIRTMGIGTNRTLKDIPSIEVHPLSIWVSTRSKWVSIRSTWARICIHFFHFKFQMMANDALLSQLLSFWHYNPTWITRHHIRMVVLKVVNNPEFILTSTISRLCVVCEVQKHLTLSG